MKRILLPAIVTLLGFVPLAPAAYIDDTLNYQGRVSVQGVNFTGTGQFKFALVDGGTNLNQTATATALATAMITSVSISSGGSGYLSPPLVTIPPPDDPGGVQATATATIDGGVVTAIAITEAGSGYFNNPVPLTIAPPPPNIEYQVYWSNAGDLAPGEVPGTSVAVPVVNGLYSVQIGGTAPGMSRFDSDIFHTKLFLRVWFDDGVHGFQLLTPDQPLVAAPYALQAKLAESVPPGSISSNQLANGSVNAFKLADGAVSAAKLGDATISPAKLLSAAAPSPGQLLRFDGSQFDWTSQGLSLPFTGTVSSGGAGFSVTHEGINSDAIVGTSRNAFNAAGVGVLGRTESFVGGIGVKGYSAWLGTGVLGIAEGGDGVRGETNALGYSGVIGTASGDDSAGVHGASTQHHGVYAYTGSADKAAIWANAPNGAEAIHGHSNGGDGVVGYTESAAKAGVFGFSNEGNGVAGFSSGSEKSGVFGWSDEPLGYGGYFYNSAEDENGIPGIALRAIGRAKIDGSLSVDGLISGTGNMVVDGQVRGETGFYFSVGGIGMLGCLNTTEVRCYHDMRVLGNIVHSGAIQNVSDARLKDITGAYERGLADISRVQTIRYTFKPGNGSSAGEPRVGVTAQALREVIPEAVKESEEGTLMMSNEPVFWAMVNAIKELKAENDALKTRLEAIEEKLK